jgi:hypothetical protein
MFYEVDFAVKVNGQFYNIHNALIPALSVSECHCEAEKIRDQLPQSKQQQIHIFIGA